LIARLEIPGIHLSVPVLEDDEAQSLTRGVGHIRETAMPGGLGTVGLAGHRDTFLRPLSRIAPRMEIRLTNASGVYRYVVDSTEVVMPEEVRVLDIVDEPSLVIVTCYPFHYIGAAPKRFIVHAHLVSVVPG
jgi:sortase A